ncbi:MULTISPECIES: acyl-CoA synthetase [unclassified Halomonas]|uniref:Acyl-CoA synthetase n=1 Tax=Halomonas sp. RT37 TaxID=2950872 RepID=A0AAU7KEA9_9GAMM|nr:MULTISPECIES: acyl-CoA synthetase [unclassified Halomonas]MBR9772771.1 acyl-CoA synthetase [Gammaproteobacteria bacterium]MBS8269116.1 acyl-CoA synthetase [Halomonas litopenaei]KJZ14049.1 acyl-CoA synthetase [Halomonas sp. S2151]MAR73217.1 acyl-CoA synthetase [Halomonas sp.]MBY5940441.1 acyl-CoA synthetase [Halomonas sp. DP5N14-9]|tara:strand:- start:1267 stop:2895 length:1629 start_codon:yes stop_codon:yes gene_type:complete
MSNIYDQGMPRNAANHVAISPLTFIERAASVYPDLPAVVHGQTRRDWATTWQRCRRLASALERRGLGKGDTVSVMLPNVPAMFEAHFGVPLAGCVLNTLNIRLDASAIAYMLEHAETRAILVDPEFVEVVREAIKGLDKPPLIIDVLDPEFEGQAERLGEIEYEDLLAEGDADYPYRLPEDEWDAISLNYTSGTTGKPKGVVYHHRGAYLNAVSNILEWAMPHHPVYLWTLPMFHCNGWCFPWTIAANAGVNVCLRKVDPKKIMELIADEKVTHFSGAPIVLNGLVNLDESQRRAIDHPVKATTAGAAPPAAVIAGVESLGIDVTHVYGLTEVYGPVTVCAWREAWDELPLEERARIKARQGVRGHMLEALCVADPVTLEPLPKDGESIGEIMMRGNNVMKGYLKNEAATREALDGGWYHTGDLAVWHADGYIEIKDRSKDIIISGGENISTIELEDALYAHPAVEEAAVVAQPDEKWGESPCAFVKLKATSGEVTEEDIIEHCRGKLARFKVPKRVVFTELPKTSTGKIQKFVLRQQAKES